MTIDGPGSEPDLLYSQEETDLRGSVRDLLAARCGPAAVLAGVDAGEPYDRDLWRALADIGATGLMISEESGGAGASARETALVLEELGRAVAPVPFLGSAVLATTALARIDGGADLLPKLASGDLVASLTVPLTAMAGDEFPETVRATGSGALTGTVTTVADAADADVLIVPVLESDGPALYQVDSGADGLAVTGVTALDQTRRLADVTLDATPARRLAASADAAGAIRSALRAGAGLLASEQLGVAEWCLEETVRYTKQRYQFGRPVGSFQALKHRMADVWLELVSARAAARNAAAALASEPSEPSELPSEVPLAVALAQAYCADVAVHAAEECVQLHGGIGMTWEHPAHLYLKRAKADQLAFGTPDRHRRAIADLADLPR